MTDVVARLAAGEVVEIPTEGSSMWPLVRSGDVVRVAPLSGLPRVGDVVLAVVGERWVLHRVVGADDDTLTLRGDNAPRGGQQVERRRVVGRAVAVRKRAVWLRLDWPQLVTRMWIRALPIPRYFARARGAVSRRWPGGGG